MQTLHIRLAEIDGDCIELRYYFDRPSQYETQQLKLSGIDNLLKQAKRDYYLGRPALVDIGKQLFVWLDGNGRWLSRAIDKSKDGGLILAIDAGQKLAHLPWEVLHDGIDFLVKRVNPVTIPIRQVGWVEETKPNIIEARPLRVLFMATSPQAVEPVLDFEREEARILEDTAELPLMLRVEESGCIEELGKLWKRYKEPFDVFHLTGHASIPTAEPFTPYFITETDTGEAYHATAAEIEKVFRHRWPQLIFLSGCRTGQAAENGAVPSMAAKLIELGAKAVLGWGRPVLETSATVAAAKLYGALAAGDELAAALADTYQYLIEENIPDWHLLRLYVGGECPAALVEPLGDAIWIPNEPIGQQFLDPATQQVRVATPEEFVGRRRTLQRCLKQLRTPSNLGVLLHGMGGVGKSTVTARLLERLIGYEMIFVYRGLDEYKLLRLLAEKCTSEKGQEILNGKLPLMQRLSLFLQQGLNYPEQRFAFVLDDFEANLELQNGMAVLQSEVVDVLMSLLKGITNSKLPHRVIITSRYDFALPELNHRLHREPLAALRGADLEKKYDRLPAFNSTSKVDVDLQAKAKRIADGNPRLLNWLDKILLAERVNNHLILQEMEKAEAEFRENILAAELLKQQPAGLVKMLGLALVYELPVPKVAIAAVCGNISNLDSHVERAGILGLLEMSNPQAEFHYRVPRILASLLEFPADAETIYRTAGQFLYRIWWEESETKLEEEALEIHRLALLGKETEIAVKLAKVLAINWNNKSRFREAVQLCKLTLKLNEDYRILHELARSEEALEKVELAQQFYQQALSICPPENETEKAKIIHNLAGSYVTTADIEKAFALFQQSLELFERMGNLQGKAATLHELGYMYVNRRDIEKAFPFLQQSLDLKERIGDVQGKAATLHELGRSYAKTGDIKRAIAYYQQSLELTERIGDVQGKAATLHGLANIYADTGDIDNAIAYYQQSLELNERIGNVRGKAATLHCLAIIYADMGELEKAIAYYQQSLEITERIGDVKTKAATLNNLGYIYANTGDIENAIAFYQQSLELDERIGDVQGKAATLHNLADIYASTGEMEKASGFYQQSLKLHERIGNAQGKAANLHCLAIIYANTGDIDQAIAFYQQSLELKERTGNVQGKAITLGMLGQLLAYKRGEFDTALNYLQQSLEILQRIKSPDAETAKGIITRVQKMAASSKPVNSENPSLQKPGFFKKPGFYFSVGMFRRYLVWGCVLLVLAMAVWVFFKQEKREEKHYRSYNMVQRNPVS
ncbi:tetratricopeptide repeat protein [Aerosakkonema funiforme]|uniref:Tetratricopeptide repeat protein n=1 Tax=Aerosakkonema funiforme FACHB-1375 TaxID=2949571 RepID=A0A926VEV6_9CYAN|nr:tetratricopeptide repeat protein [Aerosakkonema funiforme]MBD2181692.1 tetratricopeptide repeat protein [Aerosakkonema funiforme FACHB-1375]